MADYEHMGRVIGGIEDSSPPQKPRRRCICGTIISQYNIENSCRLCMRRARDTTENEA